jgi:hypothetical protein
MRSKLQQQTRRRAAASRRDFSDDESSEDGLGRRLLPPTGFMSAPRSRAAVRRNGTANSGEEKLNREEKDPTIDAHDSYIGDGPSREPQKRRYGDIREKESQHTAEQGDNNTFGEKLANHACARGA